MAGQEIAVNSSEAQPQKKPIDRTAPREAVRRMFLRVAMTSGLAAGYGMFGLLAGRFLYPKGGPQRRWQFVTTIDKLAEGESLTYVAPNGASILITRRRSGDTEDCFVALSNICPHLGCQVHWEPQNQRYFCPCHNGAFDKEGMAIAGPPASARQQLMRFPLKVERGLLFILAPAESLAATTQDAAPQYASGASLACGPKQEFSRPGGMA